jgi:uncharacterized protein with von Willebrand factor type A (vWA) domain
VTTEQLTGGKLDPDGALRVILELCAVLRRRGLPIAPPEVMDATRALALVGLGDRALVREALAATLVKKTSNRAVFDEIFEQFFDPTKATPIDLFDRLRLEFSEAELDALRDILAAQASGALLGALLGAGGGGELTRLLRRPDVVRALDGLASPLQIGFYTQRALEMVGATQARSGLTALRAALRGALGDRGDALADALVRELERARDEVRAHVRRELDRRTLGRTADARKRRLEETAFTSLSDSEVEEVRLAVRRLAEKLRGKARVRRRKAEHGAMDLRRTLRHAWTTSGVPMVPVRRRKRRDRPKLVVLCDVSDSVRLAARFMLELVYALQELFSGTRSYVFVSDLGDVTALLQREPVQVAMRRIFAGEAVSLTSNSNYGAVLVAFEQAHLAKVDRRSTVVIIGDGRNNYQPDEAWVLQDLRRRARAILWINPERRGAWALGDSAMNKYAPHCTRVLEVACASELEEAARALVAM